MASDWTSIVENRKTRLIFAVRRLLLGIGLISFASLILLLSDIPSGKAGRRQGFSMQDSGREKILPKIAVLKFASREVLDQGYDGVLEALRESGFKDGETVNITVYNPENDLPTANSMAKTILEGKYRIVITLSTPMLQVMAAANHNGKLPHVFGIVTDPFVSGVGISRENSFDRPRHLAGVGTFQPVKELFRIAKKCNPSLRKVGVAWCPSETCSEACVRLAREVCRDELNIELLEATVDGTAAVHDSVLSLIARGAEAIWIGGDNIVESASASVIKSAGDAGIPVIANAPNHADNGALIALGADYWEVGRATGKIAAELMNGRSPSSFPVRDYVPCSLTLNLDSLAKTDSAWSFPKDILDSAAVLRKDGKNQNRKQTASGNASANRAKRGHPQKIRLFFINYSDTSHVEESMLGFNEQMDAIGFVKGKDYDICFANAQGDMAALLSLMDRAKTEMPDILLLTSTPSLQAAISKKFSFPVVFGSVADPILAGAGKSFRDHEPNVTGISTMSDFDGMISIISEYFPNVQTIGTLYSPAEINSVVYMEKLAEAAKKKNIALKTRSVASPSETGEAADALIEDRIDILCQISDNLTDSGFSGITAACRKASVPLFSFQSAKVKSGGAALALSRDYMQVGRDMASLVNRIRDGEKTADIPFEQVSKTSLYVNPSNAKQFGLKIPEGLLKKADKICGE